MTKSITQEEIEKIRNDFPMLRNVKEMQNHRFCYLDNGATTFKPDCVIKASNSYYETWNANTHRGDYDIAHLADKRYWQARERVAKFINSNPEEIVFTAGNTEGMNIVAYGICSILSPGDEIVISTAEHASNVLPWFNWAKNFNLVVKFAPLDEEGKVTVDTLKTVMSDKTKVVSLAHVSNVLGNVIDAKAIAKLAHDNGAYFVLDGAQSIPHKKIDVKDLDCDALIFSGHKMLGPNGIGVLYGKKKLLNSIPPLLSGGGMNATFDTKCMVSYEEIPFKFEAGTQNVPGACGLAKAMDYLDSIGMDRIDSYEYELKQIALDKLKEAKDIEIYNPNSKSGIIDFNRRGVFSQDEGTLLNSLGICVRSGFHCAKILTDYLPKTGTVRASFYIYNNEADVDQFVDSLLKGGDILDAYFN